MAALVSINNHSTVVPYLKSIVSTSTLSQNITEDFVLKIINQILADSTISQEEKDLVQRINHSEAELDQAEPIIDQLISGAGEGHPYAYFYHFLKSVCWIEKSWKDTKGENDTNACLDKAIESLDESIRLNGQFAESYLMRAVANLSKNDFLDLEPAKKDLIQAARLGSEDAIWLLAMFDILWQ